MAQKISIAGVVLFLSLWPRLSEACSVCFSAEGEVRVAFIISTAFLTVVPLIGAGLIIWWVRRRLKQHSLDQAEHDLLPPH